MRSLTWGLMAGSLLWAASQAARANDKPQPPADLDPPGRVGRIVELTGNVSRYDAEDGRWTDAERNRPLTTGDRLSTAGGARVELRVGSTVLRLGGGTEVEMVRLDDERLTFQLHNGSLALRVRSREKAAEIDIVTREARLLPMRAGHYRFDRERDDTTFAASWKGDLRVDGAGRLTAGTGQRLELYRSREGELRHIWRGLPSDNFATWALGEDERDERRAAASGHVSPEMTGAEDLDRWGQWDRHPDYGPIWTPATVVVGWAPYRYGRWVWVRPWGWTWVDDAPWGFAPFHYGRWVYWGSRWCWAPGTYVRRPVYAPALVAWVGGPHFNVSVNIGGPAVGWVPLAPREVYVPTYRVSPVYIDRVNVHPRFVPPGQQPGRGPGHQPHTIPTGPIAYTNQGVPGAVTVVPRDVLVRREPVARAVVQVPEVQRAPVSTVAPPAPSLLGAVQPAPAGAAPQRAEPPRHDAPPVIAPARPETAPPVIPARQDNAPPVIRSEPAPVQTAPGVVSTPGRRPADEGAPRDRRDGRDGRDARVGRDRSEMGDVRPAPAMRPVQPAVQPAPAVQPVPSMQPAPQVPPAPVQPPPAPRVVPAPPQTQPPVVPSPPRQAAPAPVQRVQPPPPQRGGGEDDRRRGGQAPRHGEREREAAR
jgi:hypothetical protein